MRVCVKSALFILVLFKNKLNMYAKFSYLILTFLNILRLNSQIYKCLILEMPEHHLIFCKKKISDFIENFEKLLIINIKNLVHFIA